MKKIGFLTLMMATLLLTAPAQMGPHPRVQQAIEAMRSAREHMMHAEGEFHGHRDKAIEHLDKAIHEAEICLTEP
jgi:hypothetical protein